MVCVSKHLSFGRNKSLLRFETNRGLFRVRHVLVGLRRIDRVWRDDRESRGQKQTDGEQSNCIVSAGMGDS